MKRGPEALALAGVAAWVALFWRGPLINDVGWQLWVARQINDGAALYVDILEVNPPLWFWINAAIERAAGAAGLGGLQMLLLFLAACAFVSIALSSRLVDAVRERALLYAGLVAALFLTSPFALGQREQFVWIVLLPYVALAARRSQERPVGTVLATAVGLWAASGLALKHYFILVPLALEAWLCWRAWRVEVRPELAALALAAAAYAGALVVLTPEYLSTMVPLLRLAYHGYDEPLLTQLRQPALFAALFAIAAVVMRRGPVRPLGEAAAITAGAFALAYLLQGKAFHYHAVPALGAGLVASAVALGNCGLPRPAGASLLAGALALVSAAAAPILSGPARFDGPAREATRSLAPGTPTVMLSASGVAAWPTVYERGLDWPSRHMTLWMLPRVWQAEREGKLGPELARLAARVRREVAGEIACAKPPLVLVDSRYDRLVPEGDILAFLARDRLFATAMEPYRRRPDWGYLRVYSRAATPAADICGRLQPAI